MWSLMLSHDLPLPHRLIVLHVLFAHGAEADDLTAVVRRQKHVARPQPLVQDLRGIETVGNLVASKGRCPLEM